MVLGSFTRGHPVGMANLGGGLSDTLSGEELLCPVNESFLQGSDLVVWLSSDSACRFLKGTEPAKGPSESLHGKSVPHRCATAGATDRIRG